MTPAVSIIVPNFNGAHLLARNLPDVVAAAQAYAGPCRVIVVDDGSKDDSLQTLETGFRSVDVVKHPENRGFSEAIASGVRAAESEILIFLNSDVRPDARFITPLVAHFEDPDVFSVSPLILNEDGSVNRYSWNLKRYRRGKLKTVPWTLEDAHGAPTPLLSMYASGGSIALRKSMFCRLGGFLPIYKPFYVEDYDLGVRAWRHGWSTHFEPSSRVVHAESGTIKEQVKYARVKRIQRRNAFLFQWIHLPAGRFWLQVFPRCLRQVAGRLLRGDRIYLFGLADALRLAPEALRMRRQLNEDAPSTSFDDIIESLGAPATRSERTADMLSNSNEL